MRKQKKQAITDISIGQDQIDALLALAVAASFPQAQFDLLKLVLDTFMEVMLALQNSRTSIRRLRNMLFGKNTESRASVEKKTDGDGDGPGPGNSPASQGPAGDGQEKPKPRGHGRNGADAYAGAGLVRCKHEKPLSGEPCPICAEEGRTGRLYPAPPKRIVKMTGQPPIGATVYAVETWRCNKCKYTVTAPLPDGVGERKYDEKAAAMIAVLRYGGGMPFHRLQGIQKNLEIRVADATQWDIVANAAAAPRHVFAELVRQAAQGDVLHNDDTRAVILSESGNRREKADALENDVAKAAAAVKAAAGAGAGAKADAGVKAEAAAKARAAAMAKAETGTKAETRTARAAIKRADAAAKAEDRTLARAKALEDRTAKEAAAAMAKTKAVQTTCIVSLAEGRKVVLYRTGRAHAGQNLAKVLAHRAPDLEAPIQMCDALTVNIPGNFMTVLALCLTHGRRKFVEIAEHFPAYCLRVIKDLAVVYEHDDHCRKMNMSDDQRLASHQKNSAPVMADLKTWLDTNLKEEPGERPRVEPNSGLGKAMRYMVKHWDGMTLFLRVAGAPLDNNICERALKKAIIHRKNSYFYRSALGAEVGDIYMSLIHTCESCGANPFDYLTELQKHAAEAEATPDQWLPWNYREALAGTAIGSLRQGCGTPARDGSPPISST